MKRFADYQLEENLGKTGSEEGLTLEIGSLSNDDIDSEYDA